MNETIKTLMAHRSIRKYKKETPSDEEIRTIVRAGQQAPFASQMYSILLKKNDKRTAWNAPLCFTICIDAFKMEAFMEKRGWKRITNDIFLLLLGLQDATLAAQNMIVAGRSIGIGSCLIGDTPYRAERIAKSYKLPLRVFPLVQLVMGYPEGEEPRVRPRYPMEFTLFEDEYKFDDTMLEEAMKVMDEGYLAQDYYKSDKLMIPKLDKSKETFTFDDYSWTEHISRKWGQWNPELDKILDIFKKRGFNIERE